MSSYSSGRALTSSAREELVRVPVEAKNKDVERDVIALHHGLADTGLFSDAALAELIDAHPREEVHVHHMSGSNEKPEYLDAEPGKLSGEEVLAAVRRGRLWLSLVHIEQHHLKYAELLDTLYDQLEVSLPMRTMRGTRLANLLISSPTAEVFYHADSHPTVLWHIRGTKRLMVYPPWEERFLSRESRELCLLGMLMDDSYSPALDEQAAVFDMQPGDAAAWPQSTPHRVVNISGLNVSLSSEHHTRASSRRKRVAAANWYFRNRLGVSAYSLSTAGPVSLVKRTAYLATVAAGRLFGRKGLVPIDPDVQATARLDPNDPRGFVDILDD